MSFPILNAKVTRVRPTSNTRYSAAAIAVVSAVNPDTPGASLFKDFKPMKSLIFVLAQATAVFALVSLLAPKAHAAPVFRTQTALNTAAYNNTVIQITPMLFHRIELGMSYQGLIHAVGKSPMYCDSGESTCSAEYGTVSTRCVEAEFIHTHKTWTCHWDGVRSRHATSSLDVWFVSSRVSQVAATLPNGDIYRRDTGNTIHLERRGN